MGGTYLKYPIERRDEWPEILRRHGFDVRVNPSLAQFYEAIDWEDIAIDVPPPSTEDVENTTSITCQLGGAQAVVKGFLDSQLNCYLIAIKVRDAQSENLELASRIRDILQACGAEPYIPEDEP